jgi:hypothetical protein
MIALTRSHGGLRRERNGVQRLRPTPDHQDLQPSGHRYANIVVPYGSTSLVSDIPPAPLPCRKGELRDQDIFDVSLYPTPCFFSDQRARIFTLPAVENGSIIEYQYRIRVQNRDSRLHGDFQEDIPVLRSRFTLVKPVSGTSFSAHTGVTLSRPLHRPLPVQVRHVWETTRCPAAEGRVQDALPTKSRRGSPRPWDSTWADVSKWFFEIADSRMNGW